jgi:hypothetical protein
MEFVRDHVWLEAISYELVERLRPYNPQPQMMHHALPGVRQPHRWAILFSGGIEKKSNHSRYCNDLKFM